MNSSFRLSFISRSHSCFMRKLIFDGCGGSENFAGSEKLNLRLFAKNSSSPPLAVSVLLQGIRYDSSIFRVIVSTSSESVSVISSQQPKFEPEDLPVSL